MSEKKPSERIEQIIGPTRDDVDYAEKKLDAIVKYLDEEDAKKPIPPTPLQGTEKAPCDHEGVVEKEARDIAGSFGHALVDERYIPTLTKAIGELALRMIEKGRKEALKEIEAEFDHDSEITVTPTNKLRERDEALLRECASEISGVVDFGADNTYRRDRLKVLVRKLETRLHQGSGQKEGMR